MKNRCNSCGAPVNENFAKCPYCGMKYEQIIITNKKNENNNQEYNMPLKEIVDNNEIDIEDDARPKFNWIIFIILLNFYAFPAFLYLFVILAKQKQWDINHNNFSDGV